VFRFSYLILLLCICLISCFDSDRFESIHHDVIFERSLPDPPEWIYRSYLESKNQVYFVRFIRSEFHSPSLAYNLVRRDLHDFFDREAAYILQPILDNISKNQYHTLHRDFKIFLSKQLMVTVRRDRVIYWEKVTFQKHDRSEIGYWYYVLLPVSKQSLRLLEQTFILKKLDFARHNRKTFLIKELESCLEIVNLLRDNDVKKQSKLPKDYVFSTQPN